MTRIVAIEVIAGVILVAGCLLIWGCLVAARQADDAQERLDAMARGRMGFRANRQHSKRYRSK